MSSDDVGSCKGLRKSASESGSASVASASTGPAPIFITGTGRSGTWILYEALARHPGIHTFPREMRFLIDPDGLLDLVDALTFRYHPGRAREALYRFERLMKIYLCDPDSPPYRGFNFPAWLGQEDYWRRLDQFLSRLYVCEYDGEVWEAATTYEGRLVQWARRLERLTRRLLLSSPSPLPLTLARSTVKAGKYFPSRAEVTALASSFVGDLFGMAASLRSKATWAEKTPQHLLFVDFLWELFPGGCVVHIKRDPRGVIHSIRKQEWAPADLESACHLLANVYERWCDVKQEIDFTNRRFYEVSLEEFATSPTSVLEKIACLSGLDNCFLNLPDVDISRVNYWEREMSHAELRTVNDILGRHIRCLGYSL